MEKVNKNLVGAAVGAGVFAWIGHAITKSSSKDLLNPRGMYVMMAAMIVAGAASGYVASMILSDVKKEKMNDMAVATEPSTTQMQGMAQNV